MLWSAVLSYRLGTNSGEKIGLNQQMPHPTPVCRKLISYLKHTSVVYYTSSARTHTHTALWCLYILTRVRRYEDSRRESEEGGRRWLLKGKEAEEQGEAVPATSLLTKKGEPVTCPPENCMGKFNLLQLPLCPSYRKIWGWPPKTPNL